MSVVIRISLVQIRTPDDMRGRDLFKSADDEPIVVESASGLQIGVVEGGSRPNVVAP